MPLSGWGWRALIQTAQGLGAGPGRLDQPPVPPDDQKAQAQTDGRSSEATRVVP